MPAAKNLSFALELHLKVLVAQRSGRYPDGHLLRPPYDTLPDRTAAALRHQFSESGRGDTCRCITDFAIQFEGAAQPNSYNLKLNCVDDSPPDREDPAALSKRSKPAIACTSAGVTFMSEAFHPSEYRSGSSALYT